MSAGRTVVVIDFETCNPHVDLAKVGSTVYAQHWATEILCLCFDLCGRSLIWAPGLDPWDEISRELVDLASDPRAVFVAHNVGFEKDIWRYIMPTYGFPDIPNERWHDTQAVCALKGVGLALETALPQLGLGDKDRAGSKLTIGLSRFETRKKSPRYGQLPERTQETMERVYAYCGHDVADEVALHQRLGWLPDSERRVWLLDQRINERGIRLDTRFLAGAQRIVELSRRPLVDEFRDLTGGIAPTQVAKVCAWLRECGVDIYNLQKGTVSELIGGDDEDDRDQSGLHLQALPADARRALAIRQLVGGSAVSKLSRMAACIAEDGRAHRLLQYHGTGPGRWAGRLFNPLNFPRGTAKQDEPKHLAADPDILAEAISSGAPDAVDLIGLVVEDPPNSGAWRPANALEVVASSLRHAIIPADGHLICEGDFSQIHARTVLAIAGQHDFLDKMAAGLDPYLITAEGIFGDPEGSLTKDNAPEKRQIGKNTFLGSGFQMGSKTFCQKYTQGCLCKPGAPSCPYEDGPAFQQAKRGIDAYRYEIAPKVPDVWAAFEDCALQVVWGGAAREVLGVKMRIEDGWFTIELYDGKKLWYWNPIKVPKDTVSPTGRVPWKDAWAYESFTGGQHKWIDMYGGIITENIVMGLERQLLVRTMFRCEAENLPVICNGYDAVVCEPEEAHASWPHLKQIMEDPPKWAKEIRLPIAAEGWVGTRFKKG